MPADARAPDFRIPRSSASEASWKTAVDHALESAQQLPEGPVGLQLAFTIGPEIRWPSLWKPSIDGLSRLLGRTYPGRPWNPLDGRVVRLGLHKTLDPDFGREVGMSVWATAADEGWPELAWLAAMAPEQRAAFFAQHQAKQQRRRARAAYRRASAREPEVHPEESAAIDFGSMAVIEFRDDDDAYLAWVAANTRGFVLNIQRGLNPSDARIHHAYCSTITGQPTRGKTWTGPYIKVCAPELRQLDNWATARTGSTVARCGTCRPVSA